MAPNVALKVAVIESDQKQHVIARRARISETRFSHIVRGRKTPTDKEQERIAKALHRDRSELFPNVVSQAPGDLIGARQVNS